MPRRTLEQQIESAQEKKLQNENRLKQLIQKQNEQNRKERNHRLCKRMGMLEEMLPETITLTDEQFQQFLKRTTANDFGRGELAKIVQQSIIVPQGKPPNRNDDAAASQVEFADDSSGEVSAPSAEMSTEGS